MGAPGTGKIRPPRSFYWVAMKTLAALLLFAGLAGCQPEAIDGTPRPAPCEQTSTTEPTPCASGGICVRFPDLGEAICLPTCVSDGECESGCCRPSSDEQGVSVCTFVEACQQ